MPISNGAIIISQLTAEQESKLESIHPECSFSVKVDPDLQLTEVPALIDGWIETEAPSVAVTIDEEKIVFSETGRLSLSLLKSYKNADSNPQGIVSVTLRMEVSGDVFYENSHDISAATSPAEPDVELFTTPLLVDVSAEDYITIHVSAEDDGGAPSETSLVSIKLAGHFISNVPAE